MHAFSYYEKERKIEVINWTYQCYYYYLDLTEPNSDSIIEITLLEHNKVLAFYPGSKLPIFGKKIGTETHFVMNLYMADSKIDLHGLTNSSSHTLP